MNTPKTLRFFAKIDTLDWNCEVVTKVLESETVYENYNVETFMKCMNIGNLKAIPSPFEAAKSIGWEIWETLFGGDDLPWKHVNARCIESEVVFNMLKFVVIDDYDVVMEWRLAKDDGKEDL